MNWTGITIGLITFLVIGLFHPLVIKGEYFWGTKCWIAFMLLGIICGSASMYCTSYNLSIILGVISFSSFWSILEVFEQEERVLKGWFPMNPNRKKYYLRRKEIKNKKKKK